MHRRRLLLAAVVLAATGGCFQPSSSPPSAPVTVAIRLTDGAASPSGEKVSVAQGQQVTLTITSDRRDEIHVHGYDVEIPVQPGKHVERSFTADQTGSFEVESHEPEFLIVVLNVS